MVITNAQRDKAWIDMINGKRKTAGGKIIRTKADLLEVKQYLPMVSQAVKDAYNKRMASFRDSADSVEAIAAKYGHEMQNDAADVLADFKRNLPALYKKAADLYKIEGIKSPKYKAAFSKFFSELQRLRQIGMDQKNLYSEYLKKAESTFPDVQ